MVEIWILLCEMAPWLLLGFLIAGIMHVYVPTTLYTKYLGKRNFRSVINAAMLGVPLPLCSCGVLPTALSLHKEGATKGATVSFLIATPQTGVDSILATYSLMGLPFAILRPIAAFITALFGGFIANKAEGKECDTVQETTIPESSCCGKHKAEKKEESCCCGEKKEEKSCCKSEEHHSECCCKSKKTTANKIKEVIRYAFVNMMDEMGKWLFIGIIVAGLITILVPNDFLAQFSNHPLLGMLLALAISLPMYLCATGSIPIAVALMLKGLSPGAALVLLMAGPACNIASILVVKGSLGWKTLSAYLSSIIVGAIAMGLLVDYALPREWFTVATQVTPNGTCHAEIPWWSMASAILLTILIAISFLRRLSRKESGSCCCH